MLMRLVFTAIIILEVIGRVFLPHIASDFTWLGLIVTAAFAWAVLELFKMPWYVWLLASVAVALDGASALLELYSKYGPWDEWMHLWGGLVIAAGALYMIRRGIRNGAFKVRLPEAFTAGGTILLVTFIGFLYEFWEYLVDKLQYGYPKSLVSAYDSIEDQLFNLLGASLVLAIYFLWRLGLREREKKTVKK